MMRIGIDLCRLNPNFAGGVNTFSLGLTHGLLKSCGDDDRLVLLVSDDNEDFLRGMFAGSRVTFLNVSVGRWGRIADSILFKLSWLIREFRLRYWFDKLFRARLMRRIDGAVDVIVAPNTLLSWYGMKAPVLLCIHDIQQEYHPELFSLPNRIRRWTPYRVSAWRANVVQASSRYIRDCLAEKFPFAGRVAVIPEGVDLQRFSPGAQAEKPREVGSLENVGFIFYPAQLWAHKNHILLIDALARFRDKMGVEMPCVLTGGDFGHWPVVRAQIERHRLAQVHYLGLVPFSQLLWIYQTCRAVLALGLHESSSLPLREGAAFGKTLIGLDIPPNREAQDDLILQLADQKNPASLAGALVAVFENRDDLADKSRDNVRRVAAFDWTIIARDYRQILSELVNGRCP